MRASGPTAAAPSPPAGRNGGTIRLGMTPQPSRLHVESSGDRTLAATGIIDSHTADQLLGELEALGAGDDVRLDLHGVEFIDSSGLRALITTHEKLEGAGHELVLNDVSEAVSRLLEITGLQDHLHLD